MPVVTNFGDVVTQGNTTVTGNIIIQGTGTSSFSSALSAVTLAGTLAVTGVTTHTGVIVPSTDLASGIGVPSTRFANIHVGTVNVYTSANIFVANVSTANVTNLAIFQNTVTHQGNTFLSDSRTYLSTAGIIVPASTGTAGLGGPTLLFANAYLQTANIISGTAQSLNVVGNVWISNSVNVTNVQAVTMNLSYLNLISYANIATLNVFTGANVTTLTVSTFANLFSANTVTANIGTANVGTANVLNMNVSTGANITTLTVSTFANLFSANTVTANIGTANVGTANVLSMNVSTGANVTTLTVSTFANLFSANTVTANIGTANVQTANVLSMNVSTGANITTLTVSTFANLFSANTVTANIGTANIGTANVLSMNVSTGANITTLTVSTFANLFSSNTVTANIGTANVVTANVSTLNVSSGANIATLSVGGVFSGGLLTGNASALANLSASNIAFGVLPIRNDGQVGTGLTGITINGSGGAAGQMIQATGTGTLVQWAGPGSTVIWTQVAGRTSNIYYNLGAVGVGSTTTWATAGQYPGAPLDVYGGTGSFTTSSDATYIGSIRIQNHTTTWAANGGLEFKTGTQVSGAGHRLVTIQDPVATTTSPLIFQYRFNSATWSNSMCIQSGGSYTGYVGIGTMAPGYNLHIYQPSASLASTLTLQFSSSTQLSQLNLMNEGGTSTVLYLNGSTTSSPDGPVNSATLRNNAGDLRLAAASTSPYIYLKASSGNVGIGTVSPYSYSKLDVYGAISTSNVTTNSHGFISQLNGEFLSIEAYNSGNTGKLPVALCAYGGNVGIGTASPVCKLDIAGGPIKTYTGSDVARIIIGPSPSGTNLDYCSLIESISSVASNYSSILKFYTHGNGTTASDPTLAMTINSAQQVGIGTANPATALDVVDQNNAGIALRQYNSVDGVAIRCYRALGTIASPTAVIADSCIAGLRAFAYNGTAFSGASAAINLNAAETFTATAQGSYIQFLTTASTTTTYSEKMRILGNGNVGIGTNNPLYSLHTTSDILTGGGIRWNTGGVNPADKKLYSGADGDLEWVTNNSAGAHGFAVSNQGTKVVYLNTSGNSYFNGGNVGIGTASPATTLHVNGTITTPGFIDVTTSDPGDLISKRYSSADRYGIGQYAGGITRVFTSGTFAGSVRISRAADDLRTGAATFTDLMTVLSTGNVGIGTASPSRLLEIYSASQNPVNLRLTAYITGSNNKSSTLEFAGSDSVGTVKQAGLITCGSLNQDYTTGAYIAFSTISSPWNASGNMTEYMRINNGNVGIGTASPSAPLHVTALSGTSTPVTCGVYVYNPNNVATNNAIVAVRLAGSTASSAFYSYDVNGVAGYSHGITGASQNLVFRAAYDFSSGTIFTMDRSGNFTATGNIVANSDKRLKKNIEPIQDALEKVKKVSGYTFERNDMKGKFAGVIAQEMLEILPEVVMTDDDGMLSVAYGNITALLIQALKEETSKREALEQRLSRLEEHLGLL